MAEAKNVPQYQNILKELEILFWQYQLNLQSFVKYFNTSAQ